MRTVVQSLLLVIAGTFLGCGVKVDPPKPTTISEIKLRLLKRIDALSGQAETKGDLPLGGVQQLSADLTTFIGHLRTTGVASEEQLYQLQEAQYALSQGRGVHPLPPANWNPEEGEPLPEVRVPSGPIREILPRLRKLIEEIPDSDLQAIVD